MTQHSSAQPGWEKAKRYVPRGVSSGHRVGWQQVFTRAKGAYLWDQEGAQYTDFLNAWGPIVLGHCDERVNRAVFEAASTCDITGVGPQLGEAQLAEEVCDLMPCAEKVAFCTSGTDAGMHAVHLARAATGRRRILKFHGSYHGWSDHVAVGGARGDLTPESPLNTPNSAGLHPAVTDDVVVVEWNDEAGLRAAFAEHGDELAAAFAEGYVHSFGCVPAEPGFLETLRELCDRHAVVFVMDEVKTGFRSALGGYQSICGVTPDLAIFGKAIANGYSLAGIAGRDSVMAHLGAYARDTATIDGTYNGQPYAVAAALKTLEIMRRERTVDRLYELGDRLRSGLERAIAETGATASVVGLGSEWAVYFRQGAPRTFRDTMDVDTASYRLYHETLLEGGVLEPSAPTGDRRLNASTTEADIDRALDVARTAFQRVADQQ
ncbi:aspartate aminotransferase family protein [Gulosibacter sp. 10]|uniref:aspartate aminotransferase family protein n=1 Tax=Gulosibacter sp. 10 TaxID=1255570 RepID=UPI00097ECC05|nr:aspartate aminotransferase family protein [Gulosibacter sp. 10]SJM60317.1 Glutamate-1-semialdehyde aminotransferase [Gulosibacter sp. 10]